MSTVTLFIAYSLCIAGASLLGGKLPTLVQLTHTRTQLVMSFVAGLMLGVACYHLLPHAILTMEKEDAVDGAVWWMMIGLLLMFVLLRAFHFHQHEHGDDPVPDTVAVIGHHHHEHGGHDHRSHDHNSHDHHDHATVSPSVHPLSWVGVTAGLTLHTLIDGIALGAAIHADAASQAQGLFSIGVFVAILLHKPLDAMSITSLMRTSHYSVVTISRVNIAFALMCPLGALLFFWGIGLVGANQQWLIGSALAFSAGVFLCISLSDLLPEVQFHSHDSVKLTIALILGVALAYSISYLEPDRAHGSHAGHEHHPS